MHAVSSRAAWRSVAREIFRSSILKETFRCFIYFYFYAVECRAHFIHQYATSMQYIFHFEIVIEHQNVSHLATGYRLIKSILDEFQ